MQTMIWKPIYDSTSRDGLLKTSAYWILNNNNELYDFTVEQLWEEFSEENRIQLQEDVNN